jgi:hypothetical protein
VTAVRIVGAMLVRDEDVFVERALRNVAEACDRIHVVDHGSRDRTPEILDELARELEHVDVVRSPDSSVSHAQLQPYVGTRTWILGVDGDELYDPAGLRRLRADLLDGAYTDLFFVKGHVLNCDELDLETLTASGFLAPPSRPVTKLFNLAAVDSWPASPQRLYGADPVFRPGYDMESKLDLSETCTWDDDPLRLLHTCFLRRSSLDEGDVAGGRLSLAEHGVYHQGVRRHLDRLRRRVSPRMRALHDQGSNWKQEWYRRGPRVSVDASPFLGG